MKEKKHACYLQLYIPQLYMRERTLRTFSGLRTFLEVMGQTPPLAMVAATTLALSQVSSREQS